LIVRIAMTLLALADGGPPGGEPRRPPPALAAPPPPPPSPQPEPEPSTPVRSRPARRSWVARLLARAFPVVAAAFVLAPAALLLVEARRPDLLPEAFRVEGQLPLGLFLLGLSLSAVWVLWRVPQWQAAAWAEQAGANPRERFEIENASRGTLGQILSGVAVLAGLVFAWQQLGSTSRSVQISEQGQITDRFTSAVEQLGSDNVSARLGGIYALEQIGRDSERDFVPAMEVLAEFVRESEPDGGGTPTASSELRRDTVAAMRVIARRSPEQIDLQAQQGIPCIDLADARLVRLTLPAGANLSALCLDRADLSGAVLPAASFDRSDLTSASFAGSQLERTRFEGSVLFDADLSNSDLSLAEFVGSSLVEADLSAAGLTGTRFVGSQLLGADLSLAQMFGTVFDGAQLSRVDFTVAVFAGASLSGASGVTSAQLDAAQLDRATTLPPGVQATPDF